MNDLQSIKDVIADLGRGSALLLGVLCRHLQVYDRANAVILMEWRLCGETIRFRAPWTHGVAPRGPVLLTGQAQEAVIKMALDVLAAHLDQAITEKEAG